MINNDIHMRKVDERDDVTNYSHANTHELPITTSELEWDDTNWKIDEYGLGINFEQTPYTNQLNGSHVNIVSQEDGESPKNTMHNIHIEENTNIQSKEVQYKKLEVSKTVGIRGQHNEILSPKNTQNDTRVKMKPRLPRPDKAAKTKQNDNREKANSITGTNRSTRGDLTNQRRNSETREQLRNILEVEKNILEHERYSHPNPKNEQSSNSRSNSKEERLKKPISVNGKMIDISDFSEMDDEPSLSMISNGERSTLTDLSNFSEVDLGRLQSESFRNKSVKIRTSKSFTNKIPYFLPADKTS